MIEHFPGFRPPRSPDYYVLRDTPAELDTTAPLGQIALALDPLSLWGYGEDGWGVLTTLTPEAWIEPTLLGSWVNWEPGENAGYRKTPWGEVQLKGFIKGGTTTDGANLFTLPIGYRPARQRNFAVIQGGNAAARVSVQNTGRVEIQGVTNNAFLSLEGVRFDV